MPSSLLQMLRSEIGFGGFSASLSGRRGDAMRGLGAAALERALGVEPLVLSPRSDGFVAHHGGEEVGLDALPRRARGAPAVLELPASDVLLKTLRLPAVAGRELERLLRFEAARMAPFGPEHVHAAYWMLRRGTAGELEVQLAAVPRARVDPLLAGLAQQGVTVRAVCLAGTPPAARRARNLVGGLAAASPLWTRANRLLLAVGLVAGVAALAAPFLAAERRAEALAAELAALRPRAEAAAQAHAARAATLAREAAIARALAEVPSPVALLDALAAALPDHSWLTALSVSGREVVIDGLSREAASLPPLLEGMPGVQRVTYRAPVLREAASGLERFQFSLELERRRP